MSRHARSSRIALWAAVCALLLKAAVPLLAAGAAQLRGVPVAEVCAIYGVALPGAPHHPHDPQNPHKGHTHHHSAEASSQEHRDSHSDQAHSGDHCALTALAALAVPDTSAPAVASAPTVVADLPPAARIAARDACARWAARLLHGPPALG